jgi:hypothetical protein
MIVSQESTEVRWTPRHEISGLQIHPTTESSPAALLREPLDAVRRLTPRLSATSGIAALADQLDRFAPERFRIRRLRFRHPSPSLPAALAPQELRTPQSRGNPSVMLRAALSGRCGRRSSAVTNTVVSSRSRSASIVAPRVDGAISIRAPPTSTYCLMNPSSPRPPRRPWNHSSRPHPTAGEMTGH